MAHALFRSALLLGGCLVVQACASPDRDEGPREERLRPLPNVFVSPAGEPFRASEGAPYPVAVWFAQADANHDGQLSREEFRADALRFFDRLDKNHDGVIDGLELSDYEQTVAPEILPKIVDLRADEGMDTSLTLGDPNNGDAGPSRARPGGLNGRQPEPPKGIGVQGAAVYGLINAPEPVAAADLSLDGRITRGEFAKVIDQRFEALDKTGRGYLTLSGLPKTPIQSEILKRAKGRRGRHPPGEPPAPPLDNP